MEGIHIVKEGPLRRTEKGPDCNFAHFVPIETLLTMLDNFQF